MDVAWELQVREGEVLDMHPDEFARWIAFLKDRNSQKGKQSDAKIERELRRRM